VAGGAWSARVPGRGAEGQAAEGNDGEDGWSWRPPEMAGPPSLPVKVKGAYPPVPELFCPSCLLGGYTLEELGPATVAGRDARAVAAPPRRDVLGSRSAKRPYDRIEVAVDAELGILLRRTETSGGELVTRTELTDLTMNPPEAADPARFAPPPGRHRAETLGENRGERLSGPGWAAADLAAGGLGALIRHAPHLLGHGAADEQPEAMPSPDPAPLEPADGSPPPDEVLDLLYRSGEPRDLGATARKWLDLAAMAAPAPEGFRAAGRGGLGDLLDDHGDLPGQACRADRGPVKETSWQIFRPIPAPIICAAGPGTCCAPRGRKHSARPASVTARAGQPECWRPPPRSPATASPAARGPSSAGIPAWPPRPTRGRARRLDPAALRGRRCGQPAHHQAAAGARRRARRPRSVPGGVR
jgi:hypothetical protein